MAETISAETQSIGVLTTAINPGSLFNAVDIPGYGSWSGNRDIFSPLQ